MKRFLAVLLAGAGALAMLGACDDGGRRDRWMYVDCSQYVSCGTCTPIAGCGWCYGGGAGMCASDPNDCASSTEFTWTWDPGGCRVAADASVVTGEAGAEGGASTAPEAAAD
jgi:hypothetical protein